MQASQLKYLDEAEFFYGSRLRRCRIVDDPVCEGDRVELRIQVVRGRATPPLKIALAASTEINVFPERTPKVKPLTERWQDAVLWALEDNAPSIAIQDLLDRVRNHPEFPFTRYKIPHPLLQMRRLRAACRRLRKQSLLAYETPTKTLADDTAVSLYVRKTIDPYPGLRVKKIGKEGPENHGYIKRVTISPATQGELAIVQWMNGTTGFALPQTLQPVENPYWISLIDGYDSRQSRTTEFIPWHYRAELMKPTTGKFVASPVNAEALADLADFLGICPIGTKLIADKRNQVLSILNEHYPNWKEESLLYVNAREAGNQRSAS